MNKCPLFGKCGGCKFDFASGEYRTEKFSLLKKLPPIGVPIWIPPGHRRRADFAFQDGRFGFFVPRSKDIIQITNCPALTPAINQILPQIPSMPWTGAGSALVTECENGITIDVISAVPYFSSAFKKAAGVLPAIRVTWNNSVVTQSAQPIVKFRDIAVDYPPNGFLQPSKQGENILRELVVAAASGIKKIADLFCGLGSFTFALGADGFDIINGRDLFIRPLTVGELKKYDCVVMDPPRAGALAQSRELAASGVSRIIYVSCNPDTLLRDMEILMRGGYALSALTPVDQFPGSAHLELVGVFLKE